jgi:hypothetical protein
MTHLPETQVPWNQAGADHHSGKHGKLSLDLTSSRHLITNHQMGDGASHGVLDLAIEAEPIYCSARLAD